MKVATATKWGNGWQTLLLINAGLAGLGQSTGEYSAGTFID